MKLGGVCRMQAGKFVNASEIFDKQNNNLFPCYGGNGLRGYVNSFNHNGTYSLIGRQGALCGNVTLARGKFHATEHAIVVRPEKNNDTIWMYYLLNSLNLNQYATGQAQPGLSVQSLEKIETILPESKAEQIKIGTFLSLIDERIETQSKITEKYESLIKGITDSLFRNKKKNLKLKDCLTCHSSTLTESEALANEGMYPVYGASGIFAHFSQYHVNGDSILIIKDGSNVGKLQYASDKYSVIGTLNYLMAKNNVCLKYIYYYMRSLNFGKYKVGSGIPHIYFKDYGNEPVYCPEFAEQEKIANVLASIDQKILVERNILENFSKQKKFLYQSLFI